MADILAEIDADIGQAIQVGFCLAFWMPYLTRCVLQSSKEEIEGGRVNDFASAREAVSDLRNAVNESYVDVESWGGEFPFERGLSSIEYWKI